MNFRKILQTSFVALLLFCAAFSAFAQGAYVKLGGGYNVGTGYNSGIDHKSDGSRELVKIAYGKGINTALAAGYMFNANLGLEMNVNYLFGGKSTQNVIQYHELGGGTMEERIENKHFSRMLMLQPGIVFSAGRTGINPYARVGAIVGLGKIHEHMVEHYSGAANGTAEIQLELKGGVAMGATAAVGLDFGSSGKVSYFAEAIFNSLTYSPTKGQITEYTLNGKDYRDNLAVVSLESVYAEEINNASMDRDQPAIFLKTNKPMSSAGINLGVKVTL